MTLAQIVVRVAAWLAPSDCRDEWRREWLAELHYRHGQRGRQRPLWFALGAPIHAVSLRVQAWRPSAIGRDLRFGARSLRRRPTFACAAIAALTLGIGATVAIFSVVYGVLLKPLPYRQPDRLVQLWETNPLFNWTEAEIAPGNLRSWRERNRVFSDMAWYLASATRATGLTEDTLDGDQPMRVQSARVSANFFDVLGVRAALGRTFASGEDTPGRHREIVLTDRFWRSTFGGDPAVIGRAITVNRASYLVIGVMPAAFRFDSDAIDFWRPLAMDPSLWDNRVPHLLRAVARLKPGLTVAQAQDDLSAIARDLEREHHDTNRQMAVGVGPLDDWFVGHTRAPLMMFFAAVGLLLCIACANVANLFLARTSERVREISVRSALGASRGRLVAQLLAEAAIVAGFGTAFGVGLAIAAIRAFVALAPAGIPRINEVGLDPAVTLFAIALMAATTLLVGLAPAIHAVKGDLRGGLGAGERTTPAGGKRVRRALVIVELALTTVLLVGATLTFRSFRALIHVDPGFAVTNLVSVNVSLPAATYGAGRAAAFFEQAVDAIRALPDVAAAGATARLPLEGPSWTGDLYIDGRPEVHGRELRHKSVTDGYLETLGLHLLRGRTLAASDRADAPYVVINETLARLYFANQDPVGQRIAFDHPGAKTRWRTIAGVVSDEAQDGVGRPVIPEVYQSEFEEERSDMAILVRTRQGSGDVVGAIRGVIHAIDPQLAVYDPMTMSRRLDTSLSRERLATSLLGAFALVALLLASVGVYGVAAYSVAARTREIGVRVAFGAAGRDVLRLILREELTIVVAGLVAGAVLAAVVARAASAMLYGVGPADIGGFAMALAVLLASGGVACLVPARRALRVDPVKALRAD